MRNETCESFCIDGDSARVELRIGNVLKHDQEGNNEIFGVITLTQVKTSCVSL
jgi:hypothetical protein